MDCAHPYHLIAQDALDGRKVAVFCDSEGQVKRARHGTVAALLDLGVDLSDVTCPRNEYKVRVRDRTIDYLLADGIHGRGMAADVVYLSESARMQGEFARLMGGDVR